MDTVADSRMIAGMARRAAVLAGPLAVVEHMGRDQAVSAAAGSALAVQVVSAESFVRHHSQGLPYHPAAQEEDTH